MIFHYVLLFLPFVPIIIILPDLLLSYLIQLCLKKIVLKTLLVFVEEIQVSASNYFLVSYDVCSLFTSIPLQETLNIAVELIFQNKPELKISKKELRQLFEFVTSGTHFLFKSNFYDQIDGVSMGFPIKALSLPIYLWAIMKPNG